MAKGFHVNNFKEIIGNEVAEDDLLSFAQAHGFNYLLLYNLHYIHHELYDLTDPNSSIVLANFIKKAKTQFGIQEVGMVGEKASSFQWIEDYQSDYQEHKLFRVDVYHLEFEFWNSNLVETYYCNTYLEEEGLDCSIDGAFDFYIEELEKIKNITTARGIRCETYIGNTSINQCKQIGNTADRVLLHYYRKSDIYNNGNSIYQYKDYRVAALAPEEGSITVLPLFSAEPQFMGNWLSKNPKEKALATYLTGQQGHMAQSGTWKKHIVIGGYHWYRYSSLKKYIKSKTDMTDFQVFDTHRSNTGIQSGFSLIRTIAVTKPAPGSLPALNVTPIPNPAIDELSLESEGEQLVLLEVFTTEGRLYQSISGASLQDKALDVSKWPEGEYILRSFSNFDQNVQQLVVKHE